MLEGYFEGNTLRNIQGYKISANWNPNSGFNGFFRVFLMDVSRPEERFANAVDVGGNGQPARGTLSLRGQDLDYTFQNIDLMNIIVGATRSSRYRLLEFCYAAAVTAQGQTPIRILNRGPRKLKEGPLRDDFRYSLGDCSEHLLGYSARLSALEPTVVRLSALRNSSNCFLEKMIDANNRLNQVGAMQDVTVEFSQGSYRVTQQNLSAWHIDETYGILQSHMPPDLESFVVGNAAFLRQAVKSNLTNYSDRELIEFDQMRPDRQFHAVAVETATIVFLPGNYQDIRIT